MSGGCIPEVQLYQAFRQELPREAERQALRHVLACSLCGETWQRFELDARMAEGIRCALRGDAVGADEAHRAVPVRELPENLAIPGFVIRPGYIEGGQARVYRGVYEASQEEVAIKVFHNSALNEGGTARFLRELRSLSRLRHRNVVPIRSNGEIHGHPYLVMPWIEGLPLDVYVQQNRLDDRAKAGLIAKICDALRHAHGRGVLHLDLKPSNVRVDADGEPVVLDFGLARTVGADGEPVMRAMAAGTPAYMAPEQVEHADDVDVRADVYSVGLLMYEVVTGRRAKGVEGVPGRRPGMELALEQPPRPRDVSAKINRELEAITLRAIHPRRRRRYASAEQFHDDLERFLAGRYVVAMGPGWGYRLRKLAIRYPGPLLFAVLLVLLCGVALGYRRDTDSMVREASERLGQIFELAPEGSSTMLEIAGLYRRLGDLHDRVGETKQAGACRDYAAGLRSWLRSGGRLGAPPAKPEFMQPASEQAEETGREPASKPESPASAPGVR